MLFARYGLQVFPQASSGAVRPRSLEMRQRVWAEVFRYFFQVGRGALVIRSSAEPSRLQGIDVYQGTCFALTARPQVRWRGAQCWAAGRQGPELEGSGEALNWNDQRGCRWQDFWARRFSTRY